MFFGVYVKKVLVRANTSLTKRREGHNVITSQHSGRPQSTVRVSKNQVPSNHPKRGCGHSTSPGRKIRALSY